MAKSGQFTLTASDGTGLFGRCWAPETGAKATVAVVHGLGEHCGRYEQLARRLVRAGFAVVATDLRGHGQSPGRRGDAPSYDQLLDDVQLLVSEAGRLNNGRPVSLFGHSLGGNLVLNYVLRRQAAVAGAVAASPLLRLTEELPSWKRLGARLVSRIAPRWQLCNGVRPGDLSRDAQAVSLYQQDPLVHDRVSLRLAVQMLDAGQWALDHADRLSVPLLVMHGDADRVTSAEASREFARRVGRHCTLRLWPGLQHELHWERDREAVFAQLVEWLDHR